jgi:hypothetical protein
VEPSDSGPARTYGLAVAEMPATRAIVKDQWVANNLVHFQDHDTLYLAGEAALKSPDQSHVQTRHAPRS